MTRDWNELLGRSFEERRMLCVGLDSDLGLMPKSDAPGYKLDPADPEGAIIHFNSQIIDATADTCGIFKPNMAFYEWHGSAGINALRITIAYAHQVAPERPVILDFKRGDIDSTNRGSVTFAFDYLGADAITVSPYLGFKKGIAPFFERPDKGVIVLARTSNDGATDLQNSITSPTPEEASAWGLRSERLFESMAPGVTRDRLFGMFPSGVFMTVYELMAYRASREWNANSNVSVVAGATAPVEVAKIRQIIGNDMPILIPGSKTQGGKVVEAVQAGRNDDNSGFMLNLSRDIIFASSDGNYAAAAADAATTANDTILAALAA